jgi:hypothetical protein
MFHGIYLFTNMHGIVYLKLKTSKDLSKRTLGLHRGLWPSDRSKIFLSLSPGFESQCACLSPPWYLTCLLGLQGVQWIRGLVVVRVSWPRHHGLPKKKKKKRKKGHWGLIKSVRCAYSYSTR